MHILVKFGKEEHLRQLQSEGVLYCGSVLDFANLENDSARGDKFEKVISLELFEGKEIWIRPIEEEKESWKKLEVTYGQKRVTDESYAGNLFCMSYFPLEFESGKCQLDISEKFLKEFGDHYLLILNQPEFFRRIDKVLKKDGVSYVRGVVNYIDLKNFSGEKSIFAKSKPFSWQSEYRIFIKTDRRKSQTFNIGSINDISHLGKLDGFSSFLVKKQ